MQLVNFKGKSFSVTDESAEIAIGEVDIRGLLLEKILPGEVFLDVGAAEGIWSLSVACQGGIVYAFEPNEKRYAELERNIELNPSFNIKPVKIAVSESDGTVRYYEGGNSCLVKLREETGMEIECKKIDTLVKDYNINQVNYIKIDVEGFERNVLTGAEYTINRYHPVVIVEVHSCWLDSMNDNKPAAVNDIVDAMRGLGYDFTLLKLLENDKHKGGSKREGGWYYGSLIEFTHFSK